MAIINYTDQLKYAGKGYLDAKMMPVQSVDDLKKIPLTQRFEGFTVTVLNNGNPQDYILVGGIANSNWVKKSDFIDNTAISGRVDDVETSLNDLQNQVNTLTHNVDSSVIQINENKTEIETLKERVNSLNTNVDEETIGVKNEDDKSLYVKVLNKEGNFLKTSENEMGEKGLYVSIPIFEEDEEVR